MATKTKVKTKIPAGIITKDDRTRLLNKYRRMTKIVKPAKPIYGEKPSKDASLNTINNWIAKNKVKKAFYELELSVYEEVKKERQKARDAVQKVLLELKY